MVPPPTPPPRRALIIWSGHLSPLFRPSTHPPTHPSFHPPKQVTQELAASGFQIVIPLFYLTSHSLWFRFLCGLHQWNHPAVIILTSLLKSETGASTVTDAQVELSRRCSREELTNVLRGVQAVSVDMGRDMGILPGSVDDTREAGGGMLRSEWGLEFQRRRAAAGETPPPAPHGTSCGGKL